MTTLTMLCVLCALCGVLPPAGCGEVCLRGDALTAAETLALNVYQALQRSGAAATAQPMWEQSYLTENF